MNGKLVIEGDLGVLTLTNQDGKIGAHVSRPGQPGLQADFPEDMGVSDLLHEIYTTPTLEMADRLTSAITNLFC